jgi:hypothetical protein
VDQVNRKVRVEVTEEEPRDNFPEAYAEVEIVWMYVKSEACWQLRFKGHTSQRIVECK